MAEALLKISWMFIDCFGYVTATSCILSRAVGYMSKSYLPAHPDNNSGIMKRGAVLATVQGGNSPLVHPQRG